VLVAEDNDLNALILTSILKKENYSTEVAKDGQMAVELFKAAAPFAYDVILMDAQMPIMDGYQAARSIRGLKREDARLVRIYACTANTAQEYRDKALAAGMNGFVAKPIDVKKLLGLLEQIAAKRT
jgi:CheY-like chemotaxis protein